MSRCKTPQTCSHIEEGDALRYCPSLDLFIFPTFNRFDKIAGRDLAERTENASQALTGLVMFKTALDKKQLPAELAQSGVSLHSVMQNPEEWNRVRESIKSMHKK